jgi:hypothetical protein
VDKWDRLIAIEEIKNLKARYFRFIDTKDPDSFAKLFALDAQLDMRFAFASAVANGGTAVSPEQALPVIRGRDAIFAFARAGITNRISVHHGHMPEITIESETRARGIWAMEDNIWNAPDEPALWLHGYGHYNESYERGAEGWLIKSLQLTRLYLSQSGAKVILELPAAT